MEATYIVDSQTAFYFPAEKATANMRDLFQGNNGSYNWNGLRYLLFEYEQHLRQKAKMETLRLSGEVLRSTRKDHENIEPIYPVSPAPEGLAGRSEIERAALRNSLGNLLALSRHSWKRSKIETAFILKKTLVSIARLKY